MCAISIDLVRSLSFLVSFGLRDGKMDQIHAYEPKEEVEGERGKWAVVVSDGWFHTFGRRREIFGLAEENEGEKRKGVSRV